MDGRSHQDTTNHTGRLKSPLIPHRTSTLGYALQLVLSALQKLLEAANADGTVAAAPTLEVEAVVEAAREAPDGAVRNAALGLLTVLARAQPQRTLQHILEVRH